MRDVCHNMVASEEDRRAYVNDILIDGKVPKMFQCQVCEKFAYEPKMCSECETFISCMGCAEHCHNCYGMDGPGVKVYKKKYDEEEPIGPETEGYEFFELREKFKQAPDGDDPIFAEHIPKFAKYFSEY